LECFLLQCEKDALAILVSEAKRIVMTNIMGCLLTLKGYLMTTFALQNTCNNWILSSGVVIVKSLQEKITCNVQKHLVNGQISPLQLHLECNAYPSHNVGYGSGQWPGIQKNQSKPQKKFIIFTHSDWEIVQ
jgi:hypothetical protein